MFVDVASMRGGQVGWRRVGGGCGSGPHPSGSAFTPHFFRCGFNTGRAGGLEAGRPAMRVGPDAGWGRVDGRCGSGPHPSGSASTPNFFRPAPNAGRAGGLEAEWVRCIDPFCVSAIKSNRLIRSGWYTQPPHLLIAHRVPKIL
jgi:hypothetical protein